MREKVDASVIGKIHYGPDFKLDLRRVCRAGVVMLV